MLRVEDVSPADLARVLEINESALPHVNSIPLEEIRRFSGEAAIFRVARVNDELAGFLVGMTAGMIYDSPNFLWFRERYQSFVYVDRIVVDSGFRRKGVAGALYGDLFQEAVEIAPVVACEVNIRPANEDSMRFHHRHGFTPVGTQDTEGGKKTVSLMIRYLKP